MNVLELMNFLSHFESNDEVRICDEEGLIDLPISKTEASNGPWIIIDTEDNAI